MCRTEVTETALHGGVVPPGKPCSKALGSSELKASRKSKKSVSGGVVNDSITSGNGRVLPHSQVSQGRLSYQNLLKASMASCL